MEKKLKVILSGGGTGGHIYPLVSITREIKKIFPDDLLELHYLGPKEEIAKDIEKEGVIMKYIYTGKVRRYFSPLSFLQNIIDVFIKVPLGIIQSSLYIFKTSPDLILSKGGYGSFPSVVSAFIFRVPIFLHESDITSGVVNHILQKLAIEVFTSFQETENIDPKKMINVGNPIRESLVGGEKEKGMSLFSLKREKPILLVLGGSQGSERINELILSILTNLLEHFQVIHQCGLNNIKNVTAEADAVIENKDKRSDYHVYSFFTEEEMKEAYAVADLIISRAGSGSIFEISANGKPSILIPLPESAQNHQTKNAYSYAGNGSAIVIEEGNLTPHFFLERIRQLFSPYEQLRVMGEKARYFYNPKSARIIAAYVKEYLTR